MTLRIAEDESESGGFVFVDLGRVASSPLPALSFRRGDAEPRHLGLDGWQPEIAWLTPLSADTVGGRTVARFGPAIVDRIEELVPIEIVGRDDGSFGSVSWPFITPAPVGRGLLAADPVPARSLISRPDEKDPLPATENAEEVPRPAATTDTIDPVPVAASVATRADVRPIVEPRAVVTLPPPAEARRQRGGRVAVVLLALVVLLGGAAAYAFREEAGTLLARLRTDGRSPPAAAAAQASAVPSISPRSSAADLATRHLALLEAGGQPEAFVMLGREALEAGQGAAAFRAFEEADPAADAEAAWRLARFHDPRETDETLRAAALPNTTRAAFYYALWRNRSARHTEALRDLCGVSADAVTRDARLRTLCQS